MMEQCKQCFCYDEKVDEMTRAHEDVWYVDPDDPRNGEHHYCLMYNEFEVGIPKAIINDEVKCKEFFSREEDRRIREETKKAKQ